jgi:hypothetical protein
MRKRNWTLFAVLAALAALTALSIGGAGSAVAASASAAGASASGGEQATAARRRGRRGPRGRRGRRGRTGAQGPQGPPGPIGPPGGGGQNVGGGTAVIYRSGQNAAATVIYTDSILLVSAACPGGSNDALAQATSDDNIINGQVFGSGSNQTDFEDDNFDTGDEEDLDDGRTDQDGQFVAIGDVGNSFVTSAQYAFADDSAQNSCVFGMIAHHAAA